MVKLSTLEDNAFSNAGAVAAFSKAIAFLLRVNKKSALVKFKMAPEAGISSGAIARSAAQRRGPGAREPVKEKRLSERKIYKLPDAYCSAVIADPGRALAPAGVRPVLPAKQTASGGAEIAGKIPSGQETAVGIVSRRGLIWA